LATRLPGPSIDPDPARTYKPDHLEEKMLPKDFGYTSGWIAIW
jgi:hypothetical protein